MPKTDILDRPLPASVEAERAILGAVLLDNTAFYQTDRLTATDFSLDSHRRIFSAMCELMEDNSPVDFVTLIGLLGQKDKNEQRTGSGLIPSVGGVAYVTNLTDGLPRVKNIEQYVNIVLNHSKSRKFINTVHTALIEAYECRGPISELISSTDRKILSIEDSSKSGPARIGEILPSVNEEAKKQWDTDSSKIAIGYRTGLTADDEFTTGYRKKEVAVISGWTSDGKSALAKQGMLAQIVDQVPTLVFSREISKQQLTDDLKSFVAEIPPAHARDKRKMDLFERERYLDVDRMVRDWKFWIDGDRGLHIDEIRHRARKLIRQEGIEVIVIDYIQLVYGSGKNPTEKMEDVCAGIWAIADEENVAMVALSQMTRDEKKEKRRPRLQDLKQASRIEQDAHIVKFVFRPLNDRGKLTKNDELIIAKQRNGPTGTIWVEFNEDKLIYEKRDVKYE